MTAETTRSVHPLPDHMRNALKLPDGSRFYRCALQVNPFVYLQRHGKQTTYRKESEYNDAIVEACEKHGIEVIAVTDHYRVKDSASLLNAARNAGLYAFNGFEAVTKDGVHFLCIFDPNEDEDLERYIGDCGIYRNDRPSPIGDLDSSELLERSKRWGAVCVAAHVASDGGLLEKLSGQTRIDVWKNPNLLACALPGPVSAAPHRIRPILENRDRLYKRDRMPAILNASDVNSPEELSKDRASCFIKMSTVSVEGLRQAFLDPESRIRLHSDPRPEPHSELLAMSWDGGFLGGSAVHFNENLNVLIGGRGVGKSTMIESIRYALGIDPIGDEARAAHQSIIRHVLKSGTKVSLLVQSHKPTRRRYMIERSVTNPPVVKNEAGETLALSPLDAIPGVEVLGQHEIPELAKSPEKLTMLLERFADRDPSLSGRKSSIRLALEKSRSRVVNAHREMKQVKERLAELPRIEETLKQFREAGIEERLEEKSLLIREERLFSELGERLDQYRAPCSQLAEGLPVDTAFVSGKALEGLPNASILIEMERILKTLSSRLEALGTQFSEALAEADRAIRETESHWEERRTAIEENYERRLRELQKSRVDGAEFIQLRERFERLRPLKNTADILKRDLEAHEKQRRDLLDEWENVKATEYEETEKAAQRASNKLQGRLRIEVRMAGNLGPLESLLREVGGNLASALDRLRSLDHLSLRDLALRCREGKESLMDHYNLPPGAAERIAQADSELFMRIEELELPTTTGIELNIAPEDQPENWRKLQELSTGQRATAVLLLLLLESETPLVVDQPEDDLDNRFITEGVVPIMRQQKRRRQFLFSPHKANVPVLGDAELILGLEFRHDQAKIETEHMGSIDSRPVRELVEEILEGGKAAFEMRRSKYGF